MLARMTYARLTALALGLPLALVLAPACGGGGTATASASATDSGSSTAPASSSGGSSGTAGGPTTGGSGSESASGSSSSVTTGVEGSTTGAPATTTDAITTGPGTTGGTSSSSSSSGEASSSGEPVGGCVDVSGDYGPCEAEIGYGFDGTSCRLFSGCDCAPNCEHFSKDPVGCALDCAAAGKCDESAMHPAGINKEPPHVGGLCDEVDACVPGDELAAWLAKIFAMVDCEPANYPCQGAAQTCHVFWQSTLDAAQWAQMCAASLLPGANLQCVIWGP